MAPNKEFAFLDMKHPIYEANLELWLQNERRMRGGGDVLSELVKFDWEKEGTDVSGALSHFEARKRQAVYLNFPDRFASVMVGHMMRQKPEPGVTLNFGALGDVRRVRDSALPTRAEMLYYNADGVGADGSQWDNWWQSVAKAAVGTGHRWVLVEGPPVAARTFQDEMSGRRPYMSDYSPVAVPNWEFQNGRLAMAVIKRHVRALRPGKAEGEIEGNSPEEQTLLLTRRGWTGFGTTWSVGGWFLFDGERELKDFGLWDRTDGEIPMFPLFYERVQSPALSPNAVAITTGATAAMSRAGVTEMGNAAIAYMNLSSAADFDAFDAASSVQALAGVDSDGFNLFIAKMKEGSKYVPLTNNADNQKTPTILDASLGAVLADVFDRRLTAKRQEAVELMLNEIEAAPYASGESKKMSFTDAKAPRLAVFATELETAQNAAIYFLERLWTVQRPSGSVTWPRKFDLLDPVKAVYNYFDVEEKAGIKSPTLGRKAIIMAAKSLGLIADDEDATKIESELTASAANAEEKKVAEVKLIEAQVALAGAQKTAALNPPKPAPAPGPTNTLK